MTELIHLTHFYFVTVNFLLAFRILEIQFLSFSYIAEEKPNVLKLIAVVLNNGLHFIKAIALITLLHCKTV